MGVSPNSEKVAAVADYKVPKTVKDVQRFLGMSNCYRRFIHDYAKVARPLSKLTKKGMPFLWAPEQQSSFDGFKKSLISELVLPCLRTTDGDTL